MKRAAQRAVHVCACGEGALAWPIWKLAKMMEKKTMTTSPPEKGRPVEELLTSVMMSQLPNLRAGGGAPIMPGRLTDAVTTD